MFAFIGWNGFGSAVWMINEQGMNVLLNMFFGPVVNAARGIAAQVNAAVNNFSSNFYTAVRPQIVKSYAAGDLAHFIQLLLGSSRYSFFLIWMICLPVLMRVDYILDLWLKNVPGYAPSFVCWILLYSCVNILTNPFWSAIQAVGKLKYYIIIGSTVYLSAFPVSYIFLKLGFSPVVTFQVLMVVRAIYLFVVIGIVKKYVPLSYVGYVAEVLWPIVKVGIFSAGIMYFVNSLFAQNFLSLVAVCIISIGVTSAVIWFFGLNTGEKQFALVKIKSKIG